MNSLWTDISIESMIQQYNLMTYRIIFRSDEDVSRMSITMNESMPKNHICKNVEQVLSHCL